MLTAILIITNIITAACLVHFVRKSHKPKLENTISIKSNEATVQIGGQEKKFKLGLNYETKRSYLANESGEVEFTIVNIQDEYMTCVGKKPSSFPVALSQLETENSVEYKLKVLDSAKTEELIAGILKGVGVDRLQTLSGL